MTINRYTVLVGLLLLAVAFYLPVINNTFLSDDYDSLYRILIEQRILFRDFLRPMIDLSFYMNYFISGLDPAGYYIFNILVHVLNAWLLYDLAIRYRMFQDREQKMFAALAAFLFFLYPFHSESIVWLSGRLSSLSCMFGLLMLHSMYWKFSFRVRLVFQVLIYIVALHTYESVLFIPFIMIAFQWKEYKNWKSAVSVFLFWSMVLAVYFVWRYTISGAVYGTYAEHMIEPDPLKYLVQIAKTIGRTILPPSENSGMQTYLFAGVCGVGLLLHYFLLKRVSCKSDALKRYFVLVLAFLISLIIPVFFGISTKTNEGDRLLYFPSCFLALIISFLLLTLVRRAIPRWSIIVLLFFFSGWSVNSTNSKWIKASAIHKAFFARVKGVRQRPLVFVNLPSELEGAFIFRNSFYRSLIVHGIDTSGVVVINYLSEGDSRLIKEEIRPVTDLQGIFIYPSTYITKGEGGLLTMKSIQNRYIAGLSTTNGIVYYWNTRDFIRLF